jgi:hypothetical protein
VKAQKKFVIWLSVFLSLQLVALALGVTREHHKTPVVAEETTSTTLERGSSVPSPIGPYLGKELMRRAGVYAVGVIKQRQIDESNRKKVVVAQSYSPPAPVSTKPPVPTGDFWWRLAGCETGGKYDNPNTGNGFYGYFQFTLSTWHNVGGTGLPTQHSYGEQLALAQKLAGMANPYSQWPVCWPRALRG